MLTVPGESLEGAGGQVSIGLETDPSPVAGADGEDGVPADGAGLEGGGVRPDRDGRGNGTAFGCGAMLLATTWHRAWQR